MKRALLGVMILTSPAFARAADVAPKNARASEVSSLSVSPISPSQAFFRDVPGPAVAGAAAVVAPIPAAAPGNDAVAAPAADARGQVERAAAPLAKPGVDAAEHLEQVFDAVAGSRALGAAPALSGGSSAGPRPSGLKSAAAEALSRREALRGKRIVIVGAGYEGKSFIFEKAQELGVKIVLIDKPNTWAKSFKNVELIPMDNAAPDALARARKKLAASIRKSGRPDGITTFWEDDVVLAADLAQGLGLPYHTPAAARIARSKFETQEELERKGVAAAQREVVKNLESTRSASARRAALEKFKAAAARVGFPAVLKPVAGAAAVGTERVNSMREAVAAYERISRLVNPDIDPIFAQNSDLLLMQYLDGHEYDVDLVIRDGRPVFISLADNKPTREPSFLATGSRLPSTLSRADQDAATAHAVKVALALGFTDGVLHMEGKITSRGARLIEANARMGGAYVYDWVKAVWGVDLVEEAFLAAAGVPGKPLKPARPLIHLDGDFINTDKAGVVRELELPEAARRMPGFVRFRLIKKTGDRLSPDVNGGYARLAMLEVGGATADEARRNREAIEKLVRVVVDEVPTR